LYLCKQCDASHPAAQISNMTRNAAGIHALIHSTHHQVRDAMAGASPVKSAAARKSMSGHTVGTKAAITDVAISCQNKRGVAVSGVCMWVRL
jgi:hypothetical protein